jgi:hypothetical protein
MKYDTHIGEYDAKTNAICRILQIPATSERGRKRPAAGIEEVRVAFIARGLSAPDRKPWLIWGDFAAGKPES